VQVRRLDRVVFEFEEFPRVRVASHHRPAIREDTRARRSYGILGTYPPTACGIATFTAALADGLVGAGTSVGVIRVADGRRSSAALVRSELRNGVSSSVADTVAELDRCDLAVVQHEYGLYGGQDGEEVLEILQQVSVPTIVIAHTVLQEPSPHQRSVLEQVADAATCVVVMTDAAYQRLLDRFDVDAGKVTTIPHGATLPPGPAYRDLTARPMLLTWGLLGRGKGIEWAIDAMAELADLRPRPRYLVAGRTHPKVVLFEGEAYREMLVRRVWERGVAPSVSFDASYRGLEDLTDLVQRASVVILPYDSRDQVTSGVLVDAIAAGRPVIATAFPHAVELLSTGAGIVVPQQDPSAIAAAVQRVLTEPGVAASMAEEAARLAPDLRWSAVARRYADLGERLLASREALPA
jgi:glycosyltransferase involved in cell wall biosynthesis